MADINNFTEITENFDTIKTLLNSIRAQGVLNTSDVDKLLSGINSKLEKINTEEDIDLIKIFLSELKQNLDERHNVLLSKFGAIESLFSNLLKNSSEMLKSGEVKELFDIVATNLSVFSREVVSQKETLTDITLRLDAMRSDDSQKKEIIKNVSVLKNDIERLTNGFDSIVLSLNENFKTLIKSIAGIDPSENINKFSEEIKDIVNSSNTILSALQMLDKKNLHIEEILKGLATSDDISSAKKSINDLKLREEALAQSVDTLTEKSYKIDNIAEKIDASVGIIAGLKTLIAENDEQSTAAIVDKLALLQTSIKEITTSEQFEEFKIELEKTLRNIIDSSENIKDAFKKNSEEFEKISAAILALDINANFKALSSDVAKSEVALREHVSLECGKTVQLVDVNSTRIINEISSEANNLSESFNKAHSTLSLLCKKSFNDVEENIQNLKSVVKQIDENNVSANNAIFSNITDRLALFENDLKSSLEKQEDYVATSSSKLVEQISGIKDLSGVLDYKIDSSVMEITNAKNEFTELKAAVESVLALDFTEQVKDFKVDLYAIKQELVETFDNSSVDLNDKIANELFSKYELLISKLDSVETELKQSQNIALGALKNNLDGISSSLMDIISYVSVQKDVNTDSIDSKLEEISEVVKDNNLSYIESVRDVVEVIRTQVDNNLKSIQEDTYNQVGSLNVSIKKVNEDLKSDIKISYDKLLEVQENFKDIKNIISKHSEDVNTNYFEIIKSAESLQGDFGNKIAEFKNSVFEKISDFQQEFTCDNADKINEIKMAAENLHVKNIQNSALIKDELKNDVSRLVGSINVNIEELAEQLANTILKVEGANNEIIDYIRNDFGIKVDKTIDALELQVTDLSGELATKVDDVVNNFANLENSVNNLSTNTTNSLASTLAKVMDNFVALKGLLSSQEEKHAVNLKDNVDVIISDFENLRNRLNEVDANLDEDLTRQLSLIETNFEQFSNNLAIFFESTNKQIDNSIKNGLENISAVVHQDIEQNLELYRCRIDKLFENISSKNSEQFESISGKIFELNKIINDNLSEQNEAASIRIQNIAHELKNLLDKNTEISQEEYTNLKENLNTFIENLNIQQIENADLIQNKLTEFENTINSSLDLKADNINAKFVEIFAKFNDEIESAKNKRDEINNKLMDVKQQISDFKSEEAANIDDKTTFIINKLEDLLLNLTENNNSLKNNISIMYSDINNNINDEMSNLESHLSNKVQTLNKNQEEAVESIKTIIINKYEEIVPKLEQLLTLYNESTSNLETIVDNSSEKELAKLDDVLNKSNTLAQNVISVVNSNFDSLIENIGSKFENSADVINDVKMFVSQNASDLAEKISAIDNHASDISSNLKELILDNQQQVLSYMGKIGEVGNTVSNTIEHALDNNTFSIQKSLGEFSAKCEDTFEEQRNSIANILGNSVSKEQFETVLHSINELSQDIGNASDIQHKNIKDFIQVVLEELKSINHEINENTLNVSDSLKENLAASLNDLHENILSIIERSSLNILTEFTNNNSTVITEINTKTSELNEHFEALNVRLDKDEVSRMNVYQSQLKELNTTFNDLISEIKDVIKTDIASVSQLMIQNNKEAMEEVEASIENKVNSVLSSNAEISAGELQSMEAFTNSILDKVEINRKTIVGARDFINNFIKNELNLVAENIEKEADVIVKDVLEQTAILKDAQRDEILKLSSQIENFVEDHIFNSINDLKSYLDVKFDESSVQGKLDNIAQTLSKTAEDMLSVSSRLLESSVFDNSISDLRASNQILINTMSENLEKQLRVFIQDNVATKIDNNFKLFGKSFTDIVVDKYEEIKLISSNYNKSFEAVQASISEISSDFIKSKNEINRDIIDSFNRITNKIDDLSKQFEMLKAQVSDKTLDVSIQKNINNQISGIENLVKQQFGYLEDISELCCNSLPELTEMNTLVKYSVVESINEISKKLESDNGITKELENLKTDIITQFLNIFNQISFVAEQEEILDFIQEKHSELITILSHIVTTVDDVENISDKVSVVDNKIDTLKEDIDLINEKITSIMSSSGDIDYVYSLQDLESDIASLRLSLNEIKGGNRSKDIEELVSSTNEVYKMVEALKNEFPKFDSSEFKRDFEALSEDIVSISTRTNKLILASDESYKTLHENLQDFKLVINDLDERTRNFSQEAGIDRLDNKLGVINNMIQNGVKTNQVFNQIFEYLAEWVDNAGEKIATISDKVESLDDIGKIKVMLEDLKEESADNFESGELVEALSNVFDKQAKKIASMEAKLDRVIVETTINSKNNMIDMSPMEETLNRFLVAIDSRMASQQRKIDSLEQKLQDVIETKDTAQLTKKVGGMDRQIAKLNKSIEKIASHVVEK